MDVIGGLLVLFVIGFLLFHDPGKSGGYKNKDKDGKGKSGDRKGGGGHR